MKNAVLWSLQDMAWSAMVLLLWKHLGWPWEIPFAVCVPALLVHVAPRWVRLINLREGHSPHRLVVAPVLGILLFCGFLEPPRTLYQITDSWGNDFLWVLELVLSAPATLFLLLGNGFSCRVLGPIPPPPPVSVEAPQKLAPKTQEEQCEEIMSIMRRRHIDDWYASALMLALFGSLLREVPDVRKNSGNSEWFDTVVFTILLLGFQAFAVLTMHLLRKEWRKRFAGNR